ncbi:MAG: LamG domain-containing protein [bacterium]|nr:LamG domain-containing protein [bacterium]
MAKAQPNQTDFSGGISSSPKVSKIPNSVGFTRGVDHRTDPSRITINPRAEKEFTTDALPMWGITACTYDYSYLQNGDILRRDTSWSKIHTAGDSVGNGFSYFPETKDIIFAQNTTLGKITDACTTTNTITDDFLGAQGGEPTNTKSIDFEASSSMYASRADTASTSITGDLTLETYIKPESLPSTGNTMTLISKWDEQSNKRSYKLDIITASNFFGDGRDGALSISSNTTEDPVDANVKVGTSGATTFTTENRHASFSSIASGDKLLIWQVQGTNAGIYQLVDVEGYSGGTVTISSTLDVAYATSGVNVAYVRLLKQYTNVTISAGITYTCKAWDGAKGGIIGGYASGTVTIPATATQTAKGKGFRGGRAGQNPDGGSSNNIIGEQGENQNNTQSRTTTSNGVAGGGGGAEDSFGAGGIGGAGANTAPEQERAETRRGGSTGGYCGTAFGSSDLSVLMLGGAGGGGGFGDAESVSLTSYGGGGNGGGVNAWFGATLTIAGTVTADGNGGQDGDRDQGPGGPGAGGNNWFKAQTATLGSNITANGSSESSVSEGGGSFPGSGDAGEGRNEINYLTSVTGTASPTLVEIQDDNLGTSDGYALRLQISDDGTALESYTQNITDEISTGVWARWQVSWEDTTSTALFYKSGTLLGTKVGSMTSIDDNASKFAVAADFDSSGDPQNFYDGLMDDTRVWNDVRTASELLTYNGQVLVGTEANLIAYYEFTDDVTDSQTDGLNDLTAANSPTYSTDVPFSGVTSRLDEDQGNTDDTYSATYTLGTANVEAVANRIAFVPDKDPQKSVILSVDTVGTGNWTVAIHDALNREVATVTVVNANMTTGFYEFIFDSVFRPVIGATYHIHPTSSVADGKVDIKAGETDLADSSEIFAYFTTHYQFLVSDKYHPHIPFASAMFIGNERYIAKLEAGDVYEPHALTLQSGFRVRCVTQWREYMVFGCWKGDDITASEEGLLIFWDGIGDKMDFPIPVPEGGVNSMTTYQDTIILVAGYQGTILGYKGGAAVQRINHIPNIARDKKVEIAPGSMAMWRTYLMFGSDLSTDSELIEKGVYTLGSLDSTYPFSLGFEYPTSLGDQTASTVSLGMVYASGQNLYIGWKNSNSYGIDKVSVTNDCYENGSIESLIRDFGTISKERQTLVVRADFEPLTSGQSVRTKYKVDREDSWNYDDDSGSLGYESTVGATEVRFPVDDKGKELQIGVDLKSTSGVSPAFLGWTIDVEALEGEIDA